MSYEHGTWNGPRWGIGGGRMTPGVRALLIANVTVFLAQLLTRRIVVGMPVRGGWMPVDVVTYFLGLSGAGIARGFFWQFFTYMFLHGGMLHLFFNMLLLFFMGPETERTMGTRHFLIMYFLSGVLGGIGWFAISHAGAPCVGASGAVFGVLAAFGALFPRRPITLLVFFVLPVTMQAWQMVALLGAVELVSLMVSPEGGIAYAAHLAGGISGYIYTTTIFPRGWRFRGWRRRPRLIVLNGEKPSAPEPLDVDRILDKISERGLGSLTREERAALRAASERLQGGR